MILRDGGIADALVAMGEVEMVGGKHLARRNAGNLHARGREAAFHSRHIDLFGRQQSQLDAVVAQGRGAIDATTKVVAEDHERTGQRVGCRHRQTELHLRSP